MSLNNRLRKLEVAGRPLPLLFVMELPQEGECPEASALFSGREWRRKAPNETAAEFLAREGVRDGRYAILEEDVSQL